MLEFILLLFVIVAFALGWSKMPQILKEWKERH